MSQPIPVEGPPPPCPKCEGPMWDNRVGKRNPKAPDFKCKDKECGGVIWPPRGATTATATATTPASPAASTSTRANPTSSSVSAPQGSRGGPRAAATGWASATTTMPSCPVCGGPMWDDRLTKRNPRAPDFKCRNKPKERGGPGCEGVIWPPRDGAASPYPPPVPRDPARSAGGDSVRFSGPPPMDDAPPHEDDDLPF